MEEGERNRIIEKYMYIAERVAKKIYRQSQIPDIVYKDFDDILQEAYIGLIQAAEKANEKDNTASYVCIRAKGQIIDALRKSSWKPRIIVDTEKKIDDAKEKLEREGISDPTREQVIKKSGLSEKQYEDVTKIKHTTTSLEFMMDDERIDRNRNEGMLGITESAEEIVEKREDLEYAQKYIRKKIDHLPRRDKKIIEEFFFEEKAVNEIAVDLEISQSRVSQLLGRRLDMLKKAVKIDKEGKEIEKYINRFQQHNV